MRGKIFKQDLQMFALFSAILLPMAYLSYTGRLGGPWKIHSLLLFILLVGMLALSATEIPIYRIRTRKPGLSDKEMLLLGEMYSVPVMEEFEIGDDLVFNTSITVNAGGFILPLILALYATVVNPSFIILEILLIIIIATHLFLRIKGGIGIVVPEYIGLLAIPFALILDPTNVATVVLASGVLGILTGMAVSLVNINENTEGSPYINLGGVGNFKAVYITVLIAVFLSYSPV